LQPIPAVEGVWEVLSLDIQGPLPETPEGYKYILVIQDFATRYMICCAMTDQTAKTVAKYLVNDVFLIYGSPSRILSDQGTQFMSDLFKEVCILFNIEQLRTTSYHAMGNGAVERLNRVVGQGLRCFASSRPDTWFKFLRSIQTAHNTSDHTSTKFSPFALIFGRDPSLPTDLTRLQNRQLIDSNMLITKQWYASLKMANKNFLEAQQTQKYYYDRTATSKEFEQGHFVLLRNPPLPGKFTPKFTGPYEIIRKLSTLVYHIRKMDGGKTTIVHYNRLKKWEGKVDPLPENRITERHLEVQDGRDTGVVAQGVLKRTRGRPRKVHSTMAMSQAPIAGTSRATPDLVKRPNTRGRPPRQHVRFLDNEPTDSSDNMSNDESSSQASDSHYKNATRKNRPTYTTQTRYALRSRGHSARHR